MGNESRNTFTIIWRIENFSALSCGTLCSPTCTAENLEKCSFELQLSNGSKNDFSCVLISNDVRCGPIEIRMEIINSDGETLKSKIFSKSEAKFTFFAWEEIMKIDELYNKMKTDTLTVRCHIVGEVQISQPEIECEVMTKIGADRCYFVWEVKMPNTSSWSESKNFYFRGTTPTCITLSAPEDDVIINIQGKGSWLYFYTCRMSLVDVSGNERYSQIANSYISDGVGNFPAFFTKTILSDNKDTLLRDNKFALTCNFSVRNGIDFEEIRYRSPPQINDSSRPDPISPLQADLRSIFTCKKHADVKLLVDSETIPAHKNLLAARSPVFSAMFDRDMLESQTGVVEISDMDVKTMNSFLEFIYTETVGDMDYKYASELLIAAEKYQVPSMKEKCASFLISVLSEENVCELIVLADMVGHELLKASCLDYIKSQTENILRSPQWSQWIEKNVKLATEILCMLSTNITSGK